MLSEQAIADIYDRHSRELFIYILRFVHNREQAEDLLHDCFVSLIQYSSKYTVDEKNIRAFLYRTAHNHSINHLKRKKLVTFTALEGDYTPAGYPDTFETLFADDMEKRVDTVIRELDQRSARIFIMRREMGLSVEEIALELGISDRTVRRALRAVLDRIMTILEKEGFITGLIFFLSLFLVLIVLSAGGFNG